MYIFSNYITYYIQNRRNIINYYTIISSNCFPWVSFFVNFNKLAFIQIAKIRFIIYYFFMPLILMKFPFFIAHAKSTHPCRKLLITETITPKVFNIQCFHNYFISIFIIIG